MDGRKSPSSLFYCETLEELARLLAVSLREVNGIAAHLPFHYRHRTRKKKSGGYRVLHVPSATLKVLQRKINDFVLTKVPLPPCVFGGVRGKSILDFAATHVRQPLVFTVDLNNFFPTVKAHVVRSIFRAMGFGEKPANLLTLLTTYDNQLPQGVPTSTALSNIAMLRADYRLVGLCRAHNVRYSRWVDDLVFSGSPRLLKLRGAIDRIIRESGFEVNAGKTRTMLSSERQAITSLVVNRKLNLAVEDVTQLKTYLISQPHAAKPSPSLLGKIYWARTVNRKLGNRLLAKAGLPVNDTK